MLEPLITYLEKFPLKTVKLITYLNWVKILHMGLKKVHLTEEGLNKMKILCSKKSYKTEN